MAEDIKDLRDVIRIKNLTHQLMPAIKEHQKIRCKRCGVDFLSLARWEQDGKVLLRQITPFGSMLNRPGLDSALGRMTKNTAYESKLSGLIDEYVGNTYFGTATGLLKNQMYRKVAYMFSIPRQIKYVYYQSWLTFAVDDMYMYVFNISIKEPNTSKLTGIPLSAKSSSLYDMIETAKENGTVLEIPVQIISVRHVKKE